MNHFLKITAITGGVNEPSARLRIRQYIQELNRHHVNVTEKIPFISKSGCYWYHKYPFSIQLLPQLGTAGLRVASRIPALIESYSSDITWIQREFLTAFSTTEAFASKPRIFDVDDAIWLRLKFTSGFAKKIVRNMDGVICGNQWIADYFSNCNTPSWVVPTGIDTDKWIPITSRSNQQNIFYIGWTGTSGNYQYLYAIEPALVTFFRKYPFAKFLIVSDSKPVFSQLAEKNIHFIPWSEDIEVQAVQKMNIGIMPLKDSDWERGKCSFKMLLYMAVGIPVVVSPVGMNQEVLKKDVVGFGPRNNSEWVDALITLYENAALRSQMGIAGRRVVEKYYSVAKIIPQLAEIFHKIAR